MAECLSDDEMLAMAHGALPTARHPTVQLHLRECRDCRAVAAEAARGLYESVTVLGGGPPAAMTAQSLTPGALISRYSVIGAIGAGGSGVVYEAFDPQLGRKVALKMVRPDCDQNGRARLLREAQAMARLAHPNVVSVYDAGAFGGQVFVAMELVDGQTLARWIEERRPPWPEILRVFLEAGAGLAAAHAAGLVHRDFKPENVLLGHDERVRVTDFGLARTRDGGPDLEEDRPAEGASLERRMARPLLTLTEPGAQAGTPAYMAPEQFQGARADERTDQFNFCAALWKALYRQRPFGEPGIESVTMAQLAREVIAGNLRAPPPSTVPTGIQAILRRGLSIRAEDRFPSMTVLLAALAARLPAPGRARLARRLAAGAVIALGGTAVVLALGGVGARAHVRPALIVTSDEPSALPRPFPPTAAPAIAPVRAASRAPRREPRVQPPPPPAPAPRRYGSRLKDPFVP